MKNSPKRIIVMGSSTGGLGSVAYIASRITPQSSAVLVAPHINYREIHLSLNSQGIESKVVQENMTLEAGCFYILPHPEDVLDDDYNECGLAVKLCDGQLETYPRSDTEKLISSLPQEKYFDYILEMISKQYGKRCASVVLSGAGDDGVEGSRIVKENGGKVFVQLDDHSDCLLGYDGSKYISTMPRAVMECIQVDFGGSLDSIAEKLKTFITSKI